MPQTEQAENLVKANEGRTILGVCLNTFYEMSKRGDITRIPYGRRYRWRRDELERYRNEGDTKRKAA